MKCISCGTENQHYHRFCYYCGFRLDSAPEKKSGESDRAEIPAKEQEFPFKFDLSIKKPDSPFLKQNDIDQFNNLFDDNSLEFDLSKRIPLRRYRKDKTYEKLVKLFGKLSIITAIFILVIILFIILQN